MNDDNHTDLSNWRNRPHSTWAFQHVRELIASAEVPNDPQRVSALPNGAAALDRFALALPGGASLNFDAFLRATNTDGIVVLHDGCLVHESYAGGMATTTPHILMSASKSIVGLLAGILQARGEIDVDAEVASVLPEIASTAYRGATLRHLLDMRTGIVLDEPAQAAYRAATGWDLPVPGAVPGDLHTFFERLAIAPATHGGAFRYVSANTDLLGWVIERATGRPFAELLAERLWQPMGAAEPASVTVDARGAARATGGISATVRDVARVGQLLVDGGRDVVPADWIDDIATAGDAAAWDDGEFAASFRGLKMHYRSGWYAIDGQPQTLFAMGIHGQCLLVDRLNRLVVAKVSSQAEPTDTAATGLTLMALGAIRRCLVDGGR